MRLWFPELMKINHYDHNKVWLIQRVIGPSRTHTKCTEETKTITFYSQFYISRFQLSLPVLVQTETVEIKPSHTCFVLKTMFS